MKKQLLLMFVAFVGPLSILTIFVHFAAYFVHSESQKASVFHFCPSFAVVYNKRLK